MFEDLFVDPRTVANLWSAPLLEERLRYLRHCAQSGGAPTSSGCCRRSPPGSVTPISTAPKSICP